MDTMEALSGSWTLLQRVRPFDSEVNKFTKFTKFTKNFPLSIRRIEISVRFFERRTQAGWNSRPVLSVSATLRRTLIATYPPGDERPVLSVFKLATLRTLIATYPPGACAVASRLI